VRRIKGYGFAIFGHDVLLQHLRIRPGWDPAIQNCNVGVYTYFTNDGAINAYNLVFDHLSVSWSAGKNSVSGTTSTTWIPHGGAASRPSPCISPTAR
jgi:hypothetical protein